MSNTTIHAGNGNLINTGTLDTGGGILNLGDLRDQARIAINTLPDQQLAIEKSSLCEKSQRPKASLQVETEESESGRTVDPGVIDTTTKSAQDPQQNVSLGRRAINALKGISASVSEANKRLEESSKFAATVKNIYSKIATFFMG
jgi:hypothetical protein